jgi:hypothetical protein
VGRSRFCGRRFERDAAAFDDIVASSRGRHAALLQLMDDLKAAYAF